MEFGIFPNSWDGSWLMSPWVTSPNHEWYMVYFMATFLGDVQYSQNGTGKPTVGMMIQSENSIIFQRGRGKTTNQWFIRSAVQTGYDPTNQGLTQQGYSMLLCWFTIFGGKEPQTVHQNWVHDRSENCFVMGYTFWPYVAISLGKMMINQWI